MVQAPTHIWDTGIEGLYVGLVQFDEFLRRMGIPISHKAKRGEQ